MLDEFKVVEENGKEKVFVAYNIIFKLLEEIRKRDTSISESRLFDLLPKDLIVGLLINSRYKYENNKELTDFQKSLRHETGRLGRTYIADLYTRISTSLKEPMEEPFKLMSELTFEQVVNDYKIELDKLPKIKERKSTNS